MRINDAAFELHVPLTIRIIQCSLNYKEQGNIMHNINLPWVKLLLPPSIYVIVKTCNVDALLM